LALSDEAALLEERVVDVGMPLKETSVVRGPMGGMWPNAASELSPPSNGV
jgi:hypothetical protein